MSITSWREDLHSALASIGGHGTLAEIYDAVRKIRRDSLPRTWRDVVRRELQYHSSDSGSYQHRHDLFYSVEGLGKGVWGLRVNKSAPHFAADLGEPTPGRVKTTIYRILRDTRLSRALKDLHKNCCQLCGLALALENGETYSEAHHIRPLGRDHAGPDVAENIIVLCPNHHALLDYGAIKLNESALNRLNSHKIGAEHIDYHNSNIWRGRNGHQQ